MRTRTSTWLIVAAITLLIVVVAAWIVMPHHSEHWEAVDPKAPDAALVQRVLVIERHSGLRIAGRGLSMTCDVKIPQLKNTSPLAEEAFAQLTNKSRIHVDEPAISWNDVWTAFKEPASHRNTLESHEWMTVVIASPTLISLLETDWEYTGGAHGNTYLASHNFVWSDGHAHELGTLNDLFDPTLAWLTPLSLAVEADLRRQKASLIDQASAFKLENFHAFTISRAGLRMHFAPYEVGSFAEGIYTATVSWAKLRAYMKADSVVTRWVDEQVEASRRPESVSLR